MNVATTRGCPYHCNWCAKPIYGQRYIARSPESVADEIAWLKRTYRPDHLWITDDIFGLKPGWIEAFARAVTARNAATPFKCLMRADGVTPPVVAALVEAGCQSVWIGAESGSQRILDAMEKGTTVAQIEAASRLLREAGIEVGFFLQFGYQGETMADIELTIEMVERCRPADIGISVSYPLPGTPFYERVRAQLGAKQNWVDSSDLAMMYRASYVPEFYRELHRFVHARFRARLGAHALTTIATAPLRASRADYAALLPGAVAFARLPFLARRVHALAYSSPPAAAAPAPIIPLLTRHAAGLPGERQH